MRQIVGCVIVAAALPGAALAQETPAPENALPKLVGFSDFVGYPTGSLAGGEAGEVGVSLCVTSEGRTSDLEVVKSSGFEALDNATLKMLRTAVYEPGVSNGSKVRVCGVPFAFEWRLPENS